ncbi:hypothetical protein [Mycobacterium sp.]
MPLAEGIGVLDEGAAVASPNSLEGVVVVIDFPYRADVVLTF